LHEAVILVKPQFEAGKEFVGKGGIVASSAAHQHAVDRVRRTLEANGAVETCSTDSPIVGGDGNREFLMYARF
ncbi:MAG: SAM-dependent methyltransferase, partial [Acidobacteriota bacterium]